MIIALAINAITFSLGVALMTTVTEELLNFVQYGSSKNKDIFLHFHNSIITPRFISFKNFCIEGFPEGEEIEICVQRSLTFGLYQSPYRKTHRLWIFLGNPKSEFPHIGLTQKTPESMTSAMLKEARIPHAIRQMEGKLPPIYKAREKQAVNNNFPFSVHDNRHSFENMGHYFDTGLGRKKISPEKRQHASRNFNLWACDYVPSRLDGFSNNQISYVYKEAVVVPFFRRFPRHHGEIWNTFTFIPERNYTDFLKKKPKVRFAVDEEATSPLEP